MFKGTMCNAHVKPQQCWKGYANRSNIVTLPTSLPAHTTICSIVCNFVKSFVVNVLNDSKKAVTVVVVVVALMSVVEIKGFEVARYM